MQTLKHTVHQGYIYLIVEAYRVMLLLVISCALATFMFVGLVFYRKRRSELFLFRDLGVDGPDPHWLFGNLKDLHQENQKPDGHDSKMDEEIWIGLRILRSQCPGACDERSGYREGCLRETIPEFSCQETLPDPTRSGFKEGPHVDSARPQVEAATDDHQSDIQHVQAATDAASGLPKSRYVHDECY